MYSHLYLFLSFSHIVQCTKTLPLFFLGDTHTQSSFFFSLSPSLLFSSFSSSGRGSPKDVNVTLPAASRSYNKSLLYNNEYYFFYTYARIRIFLSFIAPNEPCDERWHYIEDKKRRRKKKSEITICKTCHP